MIISKSVREKVEKEVIAWNPPVTWVRGIIEGAGTTIGSVYFNKRSNGELRKMSYRLHVTNPSIAAIPKGLRCDGDKGVRSNKRLIDIANDQMTVLDTNKKVRNDKGEVIGRGAWRSVPLENVVRVKNKGVIYMIHRDVEE